MSEIVAKDARRNDVPRMLAAVTLSYQVLRCAARGAVFLIHELTAVIAAASLKMEGAFTFFLNSVFGHDKSLDVET